MQPSRLFFRLCNNIFLASWKLHISLHWIRRNRIVFISGAEIQGPQISLFMTIHPEGSNKTIIKIRTINTCTCQLRSCTQDAPQFMLAGSLEPEDTTVDLPCKQGDGIWTSLCRNLGRIGLILSNWWDILGSKLSIISRSTTVNVKSPPKSSIKLEHKQSNHQYTLPYLFGYAMGRIVVFHQALPMDKYQELEYQQVCVVKT